MRRLTLSCLLLTLAAPVACTEPPKPEKAKDLDKIESKDSKTKVELSDLPSGPVAVVGGVEIPNKKFSEIYDLKVQKYSERGRDIPGTADRRYRKSIVERLIWNEVLRQESEKLGVEFDQAELTKREDQQKRGIRDWDKHLTRRGETEDSLRAMYVAELREKALLEKQGALAVTDEEIATDYEKIKGNWTADKPRVRAKHILVPIGPKRGRKGKHGDGPDEPDAEAQAKYETDAKTKVDELYALATAEGAVFDDIAREHSSGPSATKGGDIGIFTHDRMAEEFSETAFSMEAGQISKPVKTKFGWHIINVTGKWPAGELPLSALEGLIRDRLRQRKLHQGRRKLKEELLEKYEITDNVAPTLGPEPSRRRPKRPKKGDAHGGTRKLTTGKDDPAGKRMDPAAVRKRDDAATIKPAADATKPAAD
ncbi:MAG: peptidylprolyl isomerase, partial [Nannocystaceae bacterium]|nr:peptidylprolyl isomerase [Nannocystaceae bacterium]